MLRGIVKCPAIFYHVIDSEAIEFGNRSQILYFGPEANSDMKSTVAFQGKLQAKLCHQIIFHRKNL